MGSASTPSSLAGPEAERYRSEFLRLRHAFESGALEGGEYLRARSAAIDTLVTALWQRATDGQGVLGAEVALMATGGYGRCELFPYSDVDLLVLTGADLPERPLKDAVRSLSQQMWDAGVRFAPVHRRLSACGRADPDNLEFALSLLDVRYIAGKESIAQRLTAKVLPELLSKDRKLLRKGIVALTAARHARYGNTPFHLEPNVKDCPGGLRDLHVCRWLARIGGDASPTRDPEPATATAESEVDQAAAFLTELRCFLHLRHERDDNTLDWSSQDGAAERHIGIPPSATAGGQKPLDAAYWMRIYFRNARSIERAVMLALARVPAKSAGFGRPAKISARWPDGYMTVDGRVSIDTSTRSTSVPGTDPETVLRLFTEVARTGIQPDALVEADLVSGLPLLASRLEDGAGLWHQLRTILVARHAGDALRVLHAVGLLDLLIPEFHGIDALVIRDAYHRYTVDEHTFVLIDTLHALAEPAQGTMSGWGTRFGQLLADLEHPELLYLAALMHDTGKGRSTGDHTVESARLTAGVLERLELEPYDAAMTLSLVRNHLEMSATLRRDIFDSETIRAFASKIGTQEALRMIVLFTYADLNAVHPDALTPWKAENLWRLYIATANYLDQSVDEERVGARGGELVTRVAANLPDEEAAIASYLDGFPERYIRTRTPEEIRAHFRLSRNFAAGPVQIAFRYAPDVSELVLVTPDRPSLFANIAGALAAWGMNIVTADGFSNRAGIVVDTFRFTDSYRTLELNESERARFVTSVHDVACGTLPVDKLLSGRRRSRVRKLRAPGEPRFAFNDEASSHSTLLEVVTDDTPGLLRALSLTIAGHGCNIEVALVDTEGEIAIDVFYLTREGRKLTAAEQGDLAVALGRAVGSDGV